ncbi:hypothetical protein Tco_1002059 [Tanacetum coccineum]|uniref:Phospholipase-like protein n=1 Tax=Tanacetum coccineum TaxID=301880 RepID=A0ABQ5F5C1_9ASTR
MDNSNTFIFTNEIAVICRLVWCFSGGSAVMVSALVVLCGGNVVGLWWSQFGGDGGVCRLATVTVVVVGRRWWLTVVVGDDGFLLVLFSMNMAADEDYVLDLDQSQENCILVHYLSRRPVKSLVGDTEIVYFTYWLGVLELVLLGLKVRYIVSDWCFRLVDNIKAWDMYPWGSYVWPTLYEQLRDAIRKRWEAHFVTKRGPRKYSLMGFTWAFKAWILDTYRVGALKFYTREERHLNVLVVLKGARPRPRLTPDDVEARANWWLASKAFFDGGRIPATMKGPVNVGEHCGLSEFSGFQNTQGFPKVGPRIFTPPSSSFFDDVRTPTLQFNKPLFDQLMSSPYPASFPPTPHTATPRAQQGFALWSSTYPATVDPTPQDGPSHTLDVVGDDNACDDDVRITGARTTGYFISYENMDPSKVKRLKYVECLTFLYNPERIYLDCHIKGFRVMESFWQELVPQL